MTEMTPYTGVISLRSRRLRTVGIALLVVLLLMMLYGLFALMPAMKTATTLAAAASQKAEAQKIVNPAESARTLRHIHRLLGIKVLFAHVYWLACSLLAFAAMLVAWLDFREVARRYRTARRSLWEDAANRLPAGERTGDL